MLLGIVKGTVVSTQKDARLVGSKLLVVKQVDTKRKEIGDEMVAADMLGAGVGELVLLCAGSSARSLMDDTGAPVDLAVVGIIDTLE